MEPMAQRLVEPSTPRPPSATIYVYPDDALVSHPLPLDPHLLQVPSFDLQATLNAPARPLRQPSSSQPEER